MKIKKRIILSATSNKKYYELKDYTDEELIAATHLLINAFKTKKVYLSIFIDEKNIMEEFRKIKNFKYKNRHFYDISKSSILDTLLNCELINKIRHFNLYVLKDEVKGEPTFKDLANSILEIYYENYLEECVFGHVKNLDLKFINEIFNKLLNV